MAARAAHRRCHPVCSPARRLAPWRLRRTSVALRCLTRNGDDSRPRTASRRRAQIFGSAAGAADRLESSVRSSFSVVRGDRGFNSVLLRELLCRCKRAERSSARRLRRRVHRGRAERKNFRRAVSSGEVVDRRSPSAEELRAMDVIPSIDLLQGSAVRLTRGDFTLITKYGAPEEVLDALEVERGSRLHVVDLEASRSGRPVETEIVRKLARRELRMQVGGGIRSLRDARTWLDCGAERIVVGTATAE